MKSRTGQKIKLTSVEELLGVPNEEATTEIEIDKIYPFENHPFKVIDDQKMLDLIDSISENGVLSPVLVRPDDEDGYEMISGHRRMHAAKLAGLTMIPAIIREMTDDEATILMVDSNIQREELLPSEKAFAYKMKMDAMRRTAGRPKKENAGQNVPNLSTDEIGATEGVSGRQIKRYIRLTELIPELLDLVDAKRLQLTAAVEISYIDKDIQKWINEYIHENGNVKQPQIIMLRQVLAKESLTQRQMIMLLNQNTIGRIPKKKVTLSEKKLYKYFPENYTASEMERIIEGLLKQWKENKDGDNQ